MYFEIVTQPDIYNAMETSQMDDWKSRQHEIKFTESMKEAANHHLIGMEMDVERSLENLSADGRGIRIRFSDYYDSYTFTISFPRNFKKWANHSFWFVYPEITKGLQIAEWLLEEVISDRIAHSSSNGKVDAW